MKSFHFLKYFFTFLLLMVAGCSNGSSLEATSNNSDNLVQVNLTALGSSLAFNLIDLEFLPGQNGELLAVGKDGAFYYLDANFNLLADSSNDTLLKDKVVDEGERGVQNIAADPNYATNNFIYVFYTHNTSPGDEEASDVNRVERYRIDLDRNAGTLTLANPRIIFACPKLDSPDPGHNHNGGGMVFDPFGNLLIAIGDGGGGASADQNLAISQNASTCLGKIHRLVPNTDPDNNGPDFTLPTEPADDLNPPGSTIYALGVRNPFTMVAKEKGDQFFGDVGGSNFEELNCLYHQGENYGWPLFEGFGGAPDFIDPAHGYAHGDNNFAEADPLASPGGPLSIMALAFVEAENAYGEALARHVIYSEFFQGWIRAIRVEEDHSKSGDKHIGHQESLTSLQLNSSDGFYYGVTLGGSDQILKLVLLP